MQQLPGMTPRVLSYSISEVSPWALMTFLIILFHQFNASVYTTRDFSHRKWIRVSSGRQSATLQKHRANPSLSGTLLVPSRPRHEVTISSSNLCNQQGAAYRLEPRTALVTLLLLNTTQVPGVTPGYLNTSTELHWCCSRTLWSIRGLFLIQTDLLPETAKMSREPEEAAIPLQSTPLIKGNPCPRSLHSGLRDQQRAPAPRAASPAVLCWLRGQHSKAGCPPQLHYMQAPPPANLRNMLTATILLGGCTGTKGGTLNLEHSHMSVQLEVCSLVTQGEIILWQFGFGCVKTHLIASKPTFKGQHSPAIDGWSWKIYINITAKTETISFIWGLQFPTLLSVKQTKTTWAFTAV